MPDYGHDNKLIKICAFFRVYFFTLFSLTHAKIRIKCFRFLKLITSMSHAVLTRSRVLAESDIVENASQAENERRILAELSRIRNNYDILVN